MLQVNQRTTSTKPRMAIIHGTTMRGEKNPFEAEGVSEGHFLIKS